ncbi:(2Fe-2S) ferredoxin domain-containing protein [Selenihalanaerobacter shriftii]|uniref:NAD(P)-dependent iron-only hydrogenase iron-sulfur protein n=1 Tax=Selenihalanaerobacter shriftii TaxID=142842 RepID=A0A1T4MV62_9FIRM|nr:(2Fe-2S) ferredoxin domain-containing protein [Selenihalanaerobacter shriftii]SJZ70734.1 NAD(P)-dependent iron-only hydrogenase iron-sulfur protein [Selenihalanaerobacter shriftii]
MKEKVTTDAYNLKNKKISSLKELNLLQEKLKKSSKDNDEEKQIKVTVAMGTCGIAAGAREISEVILDELRDRGLEHVVVNHTGCIGLCDQEPLVQIKAEDQPTVLYGNLTPKLAREIVTQHIVNNQVVGKWQVEEE